LAEISGIKKFDSIFWMMISSA